MNGTPLLFSIDWWTIFLGGVSTLAIFTFLYKENPFYRIFEHFFIGIATAYGVMIAFREFFWPKVIEPLFGLDRALFPDGNYSEPYDMRNLLFILPIVFGSLYYFVLSKRHNWIAQMVIGFSFGVSAGLAFKGIFVELLPQVFDSFRPIIVAGAEGISYGESFSNFVFVLTLIAAMVYFFFTFRRQEGGAIHRVSVAGRWMLMGCFGAFFGSTIMARMALLVDRLDFLIHDWVRLFV